MHTDAAAAERASRTLEADLVHAGLPRERAHLEVFAFQLGVANELMAGVRTELVDDADQAPRWSSTLLAALRASPAWDDLCTALRGDPRAIDAAIAVLVEVSDHARVLLRALDTNPGARLLSDMGHLGASIDDCLQLVVIRLLRAYGAKA